MVVFALRAMVVRLIHVRRHSRFVYNEHYHKETKN